MPIVAILYPLNDASRNRYINAVRSLSLRPVIVEQKSTPADEGMSQTISIEGKIENAGQIADELKKLGEISGVVAGGEFSVEISDLVAIKLGLRPSMGGPAAILRNKQKMREAFHASGVAQPKLIGVARDAEELEAIAKRITAYPVISKPVDMAGSWFVSINYDEQSLLHNGAPIFDYKKAKTTGLEFMGSCLIEQYVEGDEYSAEVIVRDGVLLRYIINKKFLSSLPNFDEIGHACGLQLPDELTEKVERNILRIIDAAAVRNSIMHVEFRLTGGGDVYIIEAGCRVAGDMIAELVERNLGIDLEKVMAQLKVGNLPSITDKSSGAMYAIRFLFADTKKLPADVTLLERKIWPTNSGQPAMQTTHIANRQGYEIFSSLSLVNILECFEIQ